MKPQLTVVIPTKDREHLLRETLGHLERSIGTYEIEVIVVNDGNGDLSDLESVFPRVKVMKNPHSGVASARNAGAKASSASVLFFLDDDIWATDQVIERILFWHAKEPGLALNLNWTYPEQLREKIHGTAFGRYLEYFGFTSLKGWNRSNRWSDREFFETNGITSQNLSIRRSTFFEAGGYNESFPHAGFEDYEFSQRLVSLGVRICIDPTIMMYHNEEDRLQLSAWLERKKRGGETRAVASALGHAELTLTYPILKSFTLKLVARLRGVLVSVACNAWVDRSSSLDFLTFRIINLLLAASIFEGYQKGQSQGRA